MSSRKSITSTHSQRVSSKSSEECVEQFASSSENSVLKFGRRGHPHYVNLTLSPDRRFIIWKSKSIGPKFGHVNRMDIRNISRVVTGQNTPQFQRYHEIYGVYKDRSLSIVYTDTGNECSLDIIAATTKEYAMYYNAIATLAEEALKAKSELPPDVLYLKDMWLKGDIDGDDSLSKSEVVSLISKMNIQMPQSVVLSMFEKFDTDGSGTFNFEEFTQFVDLLRERGDLKIIWSNIHKGIEIGTKQPLEIIKVDAEVMNRSLELSDFIQFWTKTQMEPITETEAIDMVTKASTFKINSSNMIISYVMWMNVIVNEDNDIFDRNKSTLYQDMDQPLAHYFIASSHNTYLEGDQLTSNSSVNRYINDLMSGCRCVELDCWDGDRGEPIIYHGHTMTSKISLVDVLVAIRDYGFVTSPYPIILSIENHCSIKQQERMAELIKEILGEMLLMPMFDLNELPSPNALQMKVIVKGKRLSESAGVEDHEDDHDDDSMSVTDESTMSGAATLMNASKPRVTSDKRVLSPSSTVPHRVSKGDLSADLSDITFLGTGKVHDFDSSGNQHIPCDSMCSFSENTTLKYLKNADILSGWIHHNQKHVSRIYPKGTRVDSSNYIPTPAWAAGNQMVALNYQTKDISMRLNHGQFRQNGQCGYVLKPGYLLSISQPQPAIKLTINILSAHQLPRPLLSTKMGVMDPFVSVSVFGVPEDNGESRTRTISNNGFNPCWNEVIVFNISKPEAAIVLFEVLDEEFTIKSFIAFSAVPVRCLRPGLRSCALFDINGKRDSDHVYAALTVIVSIEPLV